MRNERISGIDRSRQGSRNSKNDRSSFRSSKNEFPLQSTRDIEFEYDLVHSEVSLDIIYQIITWRYLNYTASWLQHPPAENHLNN